MRRFLKNGLAILTVVALAGMGQASDPRIWLSKSNGAGPKPGSGRPVQQPVKPKSTPPTLAVGNGTSKPKSGSPITPPKTGAKLHDSGHHDTGNHKTTTTGKKTSSPATTSPKAHVKDDVINGGNGNSTIINNNNNNIINNFGFGSPCWGGWAVADCCCCCGGFWGVWGVWGIPAYMGLWSPIHEPFVFLP